MSSFSGRLIRGSAACFLAVLFAVPTQMVAQDHVVNPADLQKAAETASQARQQNVESLTKALSSPKAEKALKAAQIDPARVKSAVSSLSESDLARLASRANKAQDDFAAGRMDDRDLLLILVAIAALILIIVAVH